MVSQIKRDEKSIAKNGMLNGRPYVFTLDTGATHTILKSQINGKDQIPKRWYGLIQGIMQDSNLL